MRGAVAGPPESPHALVMLSATGTHALELCGVCSMLDTVPGTELAACFYRVTASILTDTPWLRAR